MGNIPHVNEIIKALLHEVSQPEKNEARIAELLTQLLAQRPEALRSALDQQGLSVSGDGNLVAERDITIGNGNVIGANNIVIRVDSEAPRLAELLKQLQQRTKWQEFQQKFPLYAKVLITAGFVSIVFLVLEVNLGLGDLNNRIANTTMWTAGKLESYADSISWLGDLFPTHHSFEDIAIVVIDKKTEEFFDKPFSVSWREYHAGIVQKLSEEGVKVIVFDMTFRNRAGDPSIDERFIASIQSARAKEPVTEVFIGKACEGDEPEALQAAVSGLGIGPIQELADTMQLPVAIIKKQGDFSEAGLSDLLVQSSSLQAYTAFSGENLLGALLPFERKKIVGDDTKCALFQGGDYEIYMTLDFSAADKLRSRIVPYEKIFQAEADSKVLSDLAGKIVIIAHKPEKVDIKVSSISSSNRELYTFEIQALAINALLNNVVVRQLSVFEHIVLVIVMGVLVVAIRYWLAHTDPLLRRFILLLVLALFLVGTVCLYSAYHILIYGLYPVGLFIFAYWLTGKHISFWEVYFWILIVLHLATFVSQSSGWYDYLDLPFTILALLGLFGFVYHRQILAARFWYFAVFIIIAWDLVYNIFLLSPVGSQADSWQNLVSLPLNLLLLVPEYIALYRYGHRPKSSERLIQSP